jgi:hypothetical protein
MLHGGMREYKSEPRYGHKTSAKVGALHVYMNISTRQFWNIKIHRSVCEAFHGPAPEGKSYVLHADEDGKTTDRRTLAGEAKRKI